LVVRVLESLVLKDLGPTVRQLLNHREEACPAGNWLIDWKDDLHSYVRPEYLGVVEDAISEVHPYAKLAPADVPPGFTAQPISVY
jgi:hypothetical protein